MDTEKEKDERKKLERTKNNQKILQSANVNIRQLRANLYHHVVTSEFSELDHKYCDLTEGQQNDIEVFGVSYIREAQVKGEPVGSCSSRERERFVKIEPVPILLRLPNAIVGEVYHVSIKQIKQVMGPVDD